MPKKNVRECTNCGAKYVDQNMTICANCGHITREIVPMRESFREKTIEKNETTDN